MNDEVVQPTGCPFCDIQRSHWTWHGAPLWKCFRDAYPVSEGHTLLVPHRHVASLFEITSGEWEELRIALDCTREELERMYGYTEFNVGVNVGAAAGQTVFHLHVHVIPRREGDCESPRGGVRKVKPPLVED